LNSSGKYLLAAAVAIILVAGSLTLPLAFHDHWADVKKKRNTLKIAVKRRRQKLKLKAVAAVARAAAAVEHPLAELAEPGYRMYLLLE
jgi:1,4-dihydroxy-2-naphthoate octaprenyltransferase